MSKARDELQANIGKIVHGEFHAIHGWDTPLVNAIFSQVDTYVKEIIGEDEQPQYGSDKYLANNPNVRNDLRAEQRKKAGLQTKKGRTDV